MIAVLIQLLFLQVLMSLSGKNGRFFLFIAVNSVWKYRFVIIICFPGVALSKDEQYLLPEEGYCVNILTRVTSEISFQESKLQ